MQCLRCLLSLGLIVNTCFDDLDNMLNADRYAEELESVRSFTSQRYSSCKSRNPLMYSFGSEKPIFVSFNPSSPLRVANYRRIGPFSSLRENIRSTIKFK